jgi:hypothetical protein
MEVHWESQKDMRLGSWGPRNSKLGRDVTTALVVCAWLGDEHLHDLTRARPCFGRRSLSLTRAASEVCCRRTVGRCSAWWWRAGAYAHTVPRLPKSKIIAACPPLRIADGASIQNINKEMSMVNGGQQQVVKTYGVVLWRGGDSRAGTGNLGTPNARTTSLQAGKPPPAISSTMSPVHVHASLGADWPWPELQLKSASLGQLGVV